MSDLATRLEALMAKELEDAAWHKARGNYETASGHRSKASGISIALREIQAAEESRVSRDTREIASPL